MQTDSTSLNLLIACLCAQWCNTCCDYQATFKQIEQEFPQAQFVWVDIEDQSELVDPVEVENFPTLLISTGATPCFFGTVTPHSDTLRRLVQTYLHAEPTAWQGGIEIKQLAQRLQTQALPPVKA